MPHETVGALIDHRVLNEHRRAVGESVFRDVLDEFEGSAVRYREAMELALREQRKVEAGQAAHRLAGVAVMPGFAPLGAICLEIERGLPSMSPDQLADAVQGLGRVYDGTISALAEYRSLP